MSRDRRLPRTSAAIKQRQQATWASGDYHMIGTQILIVSELLIEALDLHSTERVLDVATGSGNAALAAPGAAATSSASTTSRRCSIARAGEPTPRASPRSSSRRRRGPALRRRQLRRRQLGLRRDVRARTRSAPRASSPRRRPGGRIGLVAHTPDGFIGHLFKTNAAHVPPPAGLRSPILWGTESRLRELFGDEIAEIRAVKRPVRLPLSVSRAYLDYWRRFYGPTLKAFDAVGEDGREALEQDLLQLIARFNRADDGTMVVPTEYLEAVIVKR